MAGGAYAAVPQPDVLRRAYPREAQEMVFDAHDRAFRFFDGACRRGIYDNMKTAVEAVFIGKDRAYNRRFPQMCGHYLVEPTACTPGPGWEKGPVENQIGIVRGRFFTPRLRFKTYDELNAWLVDQGVAYARRHSHPTFKDKTVWQVFEDERPSLVSYRGPFDGFHAFPAAVEAACAEAPAGGADGVLNILNRRRQPAAPAPIETPESLRLRFEPVADCARYDRLRGAGHGAP